MKIEVTNHANGIHIKEMAFSFNPVYTSDNIDRVSRILDVDARAIRLIHRDELSLEELLEKILDFKEHISFEDKNNFMLPTWKNTPNSAIFLMSEQYEKIMFRHKLPLNDPPFSVNVVEESSFAGATEFICRTVGNYCELKKEMLRDVGD